MKGIDDMPLPGRALFVPDFPPGARSRKKLDRNEKTMKGTIE
jgi:hypothetical protein